ncbi:MAG: hypothetical protein Q8P02_00785, partial [Candidatus Micrarchaeota archaeon]|nr:hypothetical protein [Candidatus Micrarchaeota archaeon]
AGILVGNAIMMLAFERVEEKAVESKINAKMMLGFLGPDERNTIQHLVDSGGRAYQSEVGRMPGMSRLKAHRAVQKLGEKGILSTERNGKANKLVLAPAIFEALKQG